VEGLIRRKQYPAIGLSQSAEATDL
jgi:hypothetical protein